MDKTETPLLKVEHLCQYFKSGKKVIKAVDDVSFEVYKGEVFGLVGESGCGKTTTGRSIIRLYDISGGSVYLDGERICAGTLEYKEAIKAAKAAYKKNEISKEELDKRVEENKKLMAKAISDHKNCKREGVTNRIQMIFQDPMSSLDPRQTVHDIIAEGLKVRGMKDKEKINELVYASLKTVGLVPEHASRYPHEFSGGQRQRIGIARAITLNPELIIADEPISALDVSIQAQVINLLNKLRHERNLTILFVSHDLSVVKYFSDRIAVMYFGRIVEMASSKELFANPLHPYTKSLLSAIPLPDPDFEKQRKRVTYNPLKDHDYSTEGPSLREVAPGHLVSCNSEEFERYQKEINK